jgi:hypothetical protein
VLANCTKIYDTSVMMLPKFGVGGLLPTRDNRHVLLCAVYATQHAKAAQLLHCAFLNDHLAAPPSPWPPRRVSTAASSPWRRSA